MSTVAGYRPKLYEEFYATQKHPHTYKIFETSGRDWKQEVTTSIYFMTSSIYIITDPFSLKTSTLIP
jgi:hypothetical protein